MTPKHPAKLQFAKQRAEAWRSIIKMVRAGREHYDPKMPLWETWELGFVLVFILFGHAYNRPMTASKLARTMEMPRTTVLRKLARLQEIGSVERIGNHYWLTEKFNPPTLLLLICEHLSNLRDALRMLSETVR